MLKAILLNEPINSLRKQPLINERRRVPLIIDVYYQRLSLAQKVSASQLNQFGFELQFIRGKGLNSTAIFTCEDNNLSINYLGEIDNTSPITLRAKD